MEAIYGLPAAPSTVAPKRVLHETKPVVIQVYTSTKPAVPHRAWAAAALLLLMTGGLAWVMTTQRAQGLRLPRFQPPGWSISFQPPPLFKRGRILLTAIGPAYRFVALSADQAPMALTVIRVGLDRTDDSVVICERVLKTFFGRNNRWRSTSGFTDRTKKLGPLDAVELWDPTLGTNPSVIVRGTTLEDGDAYAVSLAVKGEIGQDLYALFEEACLSIEYHSQ